MTGAVVRAHATELSVKCGGGDLRRKLDGLTVKATFADQGVNVTYSASH